MKRPYLIYAAVATALAIAIASYYFLTFPNVYDAVPTSGVGILQANSWTQFRGNLSASYTGMELKKTPLIQKLLNEIEELEALLDDKTQPEWQFASGKTIASIHLVTADNYDFLFTSSASGFSEKKFLQSLQNKKQVSSVSRNVFKGKQVTEIYLKDGKIVTMAKIKGVLIVSFTSFLVENSVKAVRSGDNIEDDKAFHALRKKFVPSGNFSAFFNFKKADVILPVTLKQAKVSLTHALYQDADWGAYNFTFSSQQVLVNGLLYSSETNDTRGDGNKILDHTLLKKIPDNTAFMSIGWNPEDVKNNSLLSKHLDSWIGDAHALLILETLEENFNNQGVLLLEVKDEVAAKKNLAQMGAQQIESPTDGDPSDKQGIFNIKNAGSLTQVFGNGLLIFDDCYCRINKDVAVFCNNPNTLNLVLDKMKRDETLMKDFRAWETLSQMKEGKDKVVYVHPGRAEMLMQSLLKAKSSLKNYLLQFSDVAIGSANDSKWTSITGIFRTGSEKRTSPGVLWRTALQTVSTFTPQIVLNVNTLEKEIFTQDTAGNIYLLNKGGEILFTKNIGERIISGVYQLDYYNNGKLQYVFNSTSHVFMIDRFGNDVASYPLRLSREATAGLTLVQDEASRSYRYYIPCDNGGVYGYESNGRPLAGWSPRAMIGNCSKSLQHFEFKGNNYFVAFTDAGKLLLMDGQGKWLWGVTNLPVTAQNFSVVKQRNDFVFMNASGRELTEISSDGNDRIKPLVEPANSFIATPISDSTFIYCFSSENNLRIYNEKGKFLNSAFIKDAAISSIDAVYIAAEKHLLVKDDLIGKVFVYDMQLEPEGVLITDNVNAVTVADLLDRNEFIAIAADAKGNIVCSRIR